MVTPATKIVPHGCLRLQYVLLSNQEKIQKIIKLVSFKEISGARSDFIRGDKY